MKTDSNYYVYAYLDPRNYEMLYVGKGKGSRKYAHLPNPIFATGGCMVAQVPENQGWLGKGL
jgi:hypothetical protein